MGIWAGVVAGALLGLSYGWFAFLVMRRDRVMAALGGIDVQLQKRHILGSKVLTIAAEVMPQEQELLTRIAAMRESFEAPYRFGEARQVEEHLDAGKQLHDLMGTLFARSERYPGLRSSETIVSAQETYREAESRLAAARGVYNSSVAALNSAIQLPLGQLIAGVAGIQAMPLYGIGEPLLGAPAAAENSLS